MEVPPTEPTAVNIWRMASANVYEWMNVPIVLYNKLLRKAQGGPPETEVRL